MLEAFQAHKISDWTQFSEAQPEVKINPETRLDLLLKTSGGKKLHYIEIKNVTMAQDEILDGTQQKVAMFPDAVTERGQKHLRELMNLLKEGHSAEIVFTVQRQDCVAFRPAKEIDPDYATLLKEAISMGVKARALIVEVNAESATITGKELPITLG